MDSTYRREKGGRRSSAIESRGKSTTNCAVACWGKVGLLSLSLWVMLPDYQRGRKKKAGGALVRRVENRKKKYVRRKPLNGSAGCAP